MTDAVSYILCSINALMFFFQDGKVIVWDGYTLNKVSDWFNQVPKHDPFIIMITIIIIMMVTAVLIFIILS